MSRWMPPDATQGSGQINRRALLRTLGLGGGFAAAGALEALLGPGVRLADAASGDRPRCSSALTSTASRPWIPAGRSK